MTTRGFDTAGMSESGWFPSRAGRFEGVDVVPVGQRDADVVESLEQSPARVVVDLEGRRQGVGLDGAPPEVDDDLGRRVVLDDLPELLDDVLGDLCGQHSRL